MVLQPIAQNAQVQRLTTALKNICRDYPAGGTVLRELLQNADDAGATDVRFILDETTYPVDPLIDPNIGQYQGPALLAYNNAIFTDTDFANLSRLGDSLKINDGSTTGRFGRGFNSVYNWTDSPSIVSRDRLLILDPHREWSEGGPVYDFAKDSGDAAIENQMAAFQSVMEHLDQPFNGTVIRVPLRTEAQATKSEISGRGTTVSEVAEVLQSFASEFGGSGLLFMRNVEKLEIKSADMSIGIQMVDRKVLRSHKLKVKDAVKRALTDPEHSFDYSFEAGIEYRSTGQLKTTTFIVHHNIQCGLMDSTLRDWAAQQKFIPWVAIAAQIPILRTEVVTGSLFAVLPLPIVAGQPVHIHGLFSVSPDRARLYHISDRSTQHQEPARWNNWLLQHLVPIAWTNLLGTLARRDPNQPAFERWPQTIDDARDPLSSVVEKVVGVIEKETLALWPTAVGYVTAKDGLLDTGAEPATLRDALLEARVPVVYVPQRLRHRANDLFKGRILCPQSLCQFIKIKSYRIKMWSNQTKHEILEYLLSEPSFIEYGGLDLFPFEDGIYRSIGDQVAFVHRDEFEKDLFSLQRSRNLDLEKLSRTAQRTLKQGCDHSMIHPSIRYRSASCLRDYCISTIFKDVPEDQDMVVLGEEPAASVLKVWTWIYMHRVDILKDLACLWLLPLRNGHYRKVKPRSPSSEVYFAPVGEVGDLMRKLDTKSTLKPLPLLDTGIAQLPASFQSILMRSPDAISTLFVKDASSIVWFLRWLHGTYPMADSVANEDKLQIAALVASHLPQPLILTNQTATAEALSDLKIFQRVSWDAEGESMEPVLKWTNLSSCSKSIGLLDGMSPVPAIEGVQFLIANESNPTRQILLALKPADCVVSVQVIEDHIIPAWENGQAENWTSSCKEQAAAFILLHFSLLTHDTQAKLLRLPVVPVMQLDGTETSRFALAAELIDPSVSELKALCFDNEEILPKERFFRDFSVALKGCGLKMMVDEAVVEHRIRCYANTNYPVSDIKDRAERLLKTTCRWTSPLNKYEGSDLRHLRWLPTVDINGKLSLKAPHDCRGFRDRLLVGSRIPTLKISVSAEWEKRLGWHSRLPSKVLLLQLTFGVQMKDREVIDAVLTYIFKKRLAKRLAKELMNLPCVLVASGLFVKPPQAFRPSETSIDGCERLQPYLGNVDHKFWQDHELLLIELEVGDRPQITDLLHVQAILEEKQDLEEPDMAVAIEILNKASEFPRASLAGLKVISDSREFFPIQDVSFGDLGLFKPKQKVNIAHPDIPFRTILRLGIDSLRERLIKGMLEIEDIDDEDEFDQRENVTTRIADTLDRYPVEATFREYLANADDAKGATKISWLLDERYHPGDKLLTPDMKRFQGPAILVHNDGVFSDDDLHGLKNVGEGSKTHDRETIGQFGRGSQTMYHWTDVPMILSGRYLLILDPQQEVLPKNQIKGKRKPGVKLELSKLRDACCDQLTPFEGLWAYTQGLDNYPGTIFRFPLRTGLTESKLYKGKGYLDDGKACRLMNNYFDEARISLLFLRRVKSIDFGIYGKPDSRWSITRLPPLDDDTKAFSELVVCSFVKTMVDGIQIAGKDKWWVAIQDLLPAADRIPDISRRVMKNVECGLAALISSNCDMNDAISTPTEPPQSKMFSTLPLPISSDLPVHINATFLLTGDRQSIAVDEDGIQTALSKWNRYLLQDALPKLYLSFLDEIGIQVRQRVFEFWPQAEPPKRSPSELIFASFWQELPKGSHRLFPMAQTSMQLSQRRPAQLCDIKQAVFDLLPEDESEILAPLLLHLEVNLVRLIPSEVARHLRALPGVQIVSGARLRRLFKQDSSNMWLALEMARNPSILKVLFGQLMPNDVDLLDLDGCQILPSVDGGLNTLKIVVTNSAESPKYYAASKKELKLFEFASEYLVAASTAKKMGPVLASGKFNLVNLQLCHVKTLLKMKPIVSAPNPEADAWLTKFWEFWNGNINSPKYSSAIDASDAQLFRSTCNGVDRYATPIQFRQLPAVVEPSIGQHQRLCDKIPGLYRFNPNMMPSLLTENEKPLYKEASFYRFIRALRILASDTGMGTFVKIHLDLDDIKILRGLVISHITGHILQREPKHFHELSSDLKSIPLWQSFNGVSKEQLISADKALMAANSDLLVPWMKDNQRFLKLPLPDGHQDCLLNLGVRQLSNYVVLEDYVLPLPSTLSESHWQYFQTLIPTISAMSEAADSSRTFLRALRQSKIAADGNRDLKKACQLYDHEDRIFTSAFRNQMETRFLHDSLKEYRTLWLTVGLRHQRENFVDPGDYLQCLQVMTSRLSTDTSRMDLYLEQDSRTVLSLLTAPNFNIHRYDTDNWLDISQERVFLSTTAFIAEPDYRQNAMYLLADKQRLLSLSEVISYNYVGVCWSQTPFPLHKPTSEVLAMIPGNGRPKAQMVWQHLQHMRDASRNLKHFQVREFLNDLCLTYEYLQDNVEESSASFHLTESAIWLNLNTMDRVTVSVNDIKSSWQALAELVLSSSCDAGPIKAVKPGLMRYEKLLRALGCSSITYPTVERPEVVPGRSVSNSIRQLRNDGKLLDITYSSEGMRVQAHRVVLAAMSEKCALQFSGRWKTEDLIKYDEADDPDGYLSYHTVSTMIDYAYEDEIDWEEMEVLESDDVDERDAKLHMLLDLHKGADCWLIPSLKSQVEAKILDAGKLFINLENVIEVRDRAGQVGAKAVEQMCVRFIQQNQDAVEKAHSGNFTAEA
ncbi:Uncharacterized protein BP5553_10023 [Venustampulla echinocandica]|uniref:BTB domain-containing protein n=1 Tax=Venustampulla echinocandica TaxID=2656787 RepID=A0A370TA41_9HELO|nr:Uncharacterized protein BP5553_10023 [Venustampulla echinocandica]RDL30678.1 Uncharacterized protein BP5553_10023 [Venustampulla echinocandica]